MLPLLCEEDEEEEETRTPSKSAIWRAALLLLPPRMWRMLTRPNRGSMAYLE
jgi:hypothetical protein